MITDDIFILVCVALIWGTTNSLIKKSSANKYFSNKNSSKFEIYDWLSNPLYVLSVVVNLSGSLLFFYKLAASSKF